MSAFALVKEARLQPIFAMAARQPLGPRLVARYEALLRANETARSDAHFDGVRQVAGSTQGSGGDADRAGGD